MLSRFFQKRYRHWLAVFELGFHLLISKEMAFFTISSRNAIAL